jgi:hypothetical protein
MYCNEKRTKVITILIVIEKGEGREREKMRGREGAKIQH